MKITFLKPYLFPPKKYIELLSEVDVVVVLTETPFVKRKYNRTNILANKWLTIPVHHPEKYKTTPLSKIRVMDADSEWNEKFAEDLYSQYDEVSIDGHPILKSIFNMYKMDLLVDIVIKTLKDTLKYYNISTKIHTAKELSLFCETQKDLIKCCKKLQTTEFVYLEENRNSYDELAFQRHNISTKEIVSKNKSKLSVLDDCFSWYNVT